ncbi:NADH dehydrogenase [Photobacterium iliopiscarium]|jgi:NADH dehydrogenase|uniref:NAD(P)/FAD-dependent oxidoreductase n=1 Tax=Photobacterium iliopiscarium TaxID=56192 RepID=A0A0D8P2P4_9GAMM|nr:NAD(P)/FAD-dependent oxidoreductase [Photobacterium iliopiscarium]KJG12142.1 NADH dehydrogenase [Photobacterium iliopiscarium]KJG19815.1 NADH dehydrogenase [Photobacterium iliopiscarium]MCD9468129.1 NAD(P)/FAD-dependent oxidoreductase [Photobacterium iliopiscarium]MCD9488617.1 NAD(P)/FAD-dependent oxidoreductase [Photobacterium iliopiscarium]MCF2244684.1 NAD(P)/FAD-dependent oxidoreductase [Photobacterium iliopiscarium]
MSRIVIVGGGAAGIELSTLLAKANHKKHEIILVEPETDHYWKPRLHEIAAGTFDRELDSVCYFTHGAINGYQHYQAAMTDINREDKMLVVRRNDGTQAMVKYDYLVVAVGAVSNDFNTTGARDNCIFLDSASQARHAWNKISQLLREGNDRTVNIVGAGATGVELAAELARVSHKLQRYNAAKLTINLIEAADRVLPNSPQKMSSKVLKELQRTNINVLLNTRISEVSDHGMVTADNQPLDADIQFWAAGVKAPDWLNGVGGLEYNRMNQILVNANLTTTVDDSIFSLGDCASIPQADGSFVPPKAQAANRAAVHLTKSLTNLLRGKELTDFEFKDGGMVVAVGHHFAVGSFAPHSKMADKLVFKGRLIRRLYDTIFRLHQRTVEGLFTVSRLIITKRLKALFQPNGM